MAARSEAEANSLLVYKSPAWKGGALYFAVGHNYVRGALGRFVVTALEAVFQIRGPDQRRHFGQEGCFIFLSGYGR